jgi:xylose isomerase
LNWKFLFSSFIDVIHALQGYVNTAESVTLLHYFCDKLFYMHFNDKWRMWNDDMTFGSVHTIESLELIYWLYRLNYKSWFALDIFPYREDGLRAANESIKCIKGFNDVLDKIGRNEIGKVISEGDAMSMSALMRKAFLG